MGFGSHGFFVTDPGYQLEKKDFNTMLSVYLSEWISHLNYKKYKKRLDVELSQFSQIEATILDGGDKEQIFKGKLIKRNDYILHELKCLEARINSIKDVIISGGWDVRRIEDFISFFEIEDREKNSGDNIAFLKEYRERLLFQFDSGEKLLTRISCISKDCTLYYFALMYVDHCKTQKLLLKLYDPTIPVQTTVHRKEGNFTATQWMLYHYILQEAKKKPAFPLGGKGKALKILQKEYGISAQNLKEKYNPIFQSGGKSGYSEDDAKKVRKLIESKHPESLEKFKDITGHILL